ncbi:hypothetical protein X975_09692, partial [Stegodyphus mimosarum]
MVNSHLAYYLEKNNGFNRGRTPIDSMLHLESCICKDFGKRNHLVSFFFYIEKAYDKARKYVILSNMSICEFFAVLVCAGTYRFSLRIFCRQGLIK